MLLNLELKHLQIHVPKTGGESLMMMMTKEGSWNDSRNGNYAPFLNLGAHAKPHAFTNNKKLYEIIKDFYKTTMIRNPWEHAVSYYRHSLDKKQFLNENFFRYKHFSQLTNEEKIKLDVSFERFIENYYPDHCQSMYTQEIPDKFIFDEWFDYEEYEKMINTFEKKYKIKIINNLRRHDKTKLDYVIEMDFNEPYRTFYNEKTYNIVKNVSLNEINRFNYKF